MLRILKTLFYTRIDVPFRVYALTLVLIRISTGSLLHCCAICKTPAINISLARPFRECSIEVGHSAGARLGCHSS